MELSLILGHLASIWILFVGVWGPPPTHEHTYPYTLALVSEPFNAQQNTLYLRIATLNPCHLKYDLWTSRQQYLLGDCWKCRISGLTLTYWIETCLFSKILKCFPGSSVVKNLPANAGDARDTGSTPGLGWCPGGGHGNLHLYSCLDSPMDRGALWAKSIGL